jgi:seryl-tRNA synthetase
VKWAAKVKGFDDHTDAIIALDARVRELKTRTETKTAEKNKITKQIPTATDKAALVAESKKIGDEVAADLAALTAAEKELNDLMHLVPQIPSKDSPVGPDETFNKVVAETGTPKKFDFKALNHWELLDMHGWWFGEKLAEISGPRTYALVGEAAELDLAIQTFVIQKLIKKGFKFISAPAIVKPEMIFEAGHFKGADMSVMDNDVFLLNAPDKGLAGTSEIIMNGLHAGEILDGATLPIRYAGYSHCFRKEAGAAGRDTRGLIRVHEFHKVEQFIFCRPEESDAMYSELLANLQEVFDDLEVPNHTIDLSTGDMGFNKVKTSDVEVWIPGGARWVEVGSCSAIGEFQARRTDTRYRDADGVHYCATLNNTAVALPRALAIVLENHQNADWSVNIPEKLRPLMGGRTKIGA